MKLSKGWGGSLSRKGSRIKWFQSSHCIPPDAQRFWATSKTGPVGEIVMTFGGPKNPSCLRRVQMWGLQFVAGAARGRGIHGTRASRGSNGGGDMWWTRILGVTFWKMHQVTMAFCFFFTGGKFLLKDLVSKSPNGCAFFQAVGLKEHFFF